jgi:dTDP-4-dehydrorhamnose reductase
VEALKRENCLIKVLVTGAGGQLGSNVIPLLSQYNIKVTALSKIELDINDFSKLGELIGAHKYDFLLNCAAYTDLDSAETNHTMNFQINAVAPTEIAKLCKASGIKLIHISTDAVFGSEVPHYFKVNDSPCPVNAYGAAKADGEQGVLEQFPGGSMIIRTSWLYGRDSGKFYQSIVSSAKSQKQINVVGDQFGQPTNVGDLSHFILKCISGAFTPGIFHYTGETVVSRFDFARLIYRFHGVDENLVSISETKSSPGVATRPKYSLLDIKSEKTISIYPFAGIENSLSSTINR